MRKKRIFLFVMLLCMAVFSKVAFGGYQWGYFSNGIGRGELSSNYSNQMRDVHAQSIVPLTYYSSLSVIYTYQNGSEYIYSSSINQGATIYNDGFEWTEDYESMHCGHAGPMMLPDAHMLFLSVN